MSDPRSPGAPSPRSVPRVSAIVPTLNEAPALPALLVALMGEVDEVVVADGGSEDATVQVAQRAGARVVTGARGRGPQMNAGAAVARGDVLWFVHADTRVPMGAGQALRQVAVHGDWGCFAVRIDSGDPRLWFAGRFMSRRARASGSCTGDMGQWFRRPLFDALGGFPDLPAFEDLTLADRARRRSRALVVPVPLFTSARRWEVEGVGRTVALMWGLRLGYRLGVDPARLAAWYRSNPRQR